MSTSGGSTRATHFERAGYWFGATAFIAVIGVLCIQIALAQFSKAGSRQDLWSYGWFQLGFVVEGIAFVCFLRALFLGWRNWRRESEANSRNAPPHIEIPEVSKDQPESVVPGEKFASSLPRIDVKPYKFVRMFKRNTNIRAQEMSAPYAQRLLRFKGVIKDVKPSRGYFEPDYLDVKFRAGFLATFNSVDVHGHFSEDYREQFTMLPRGRRVTVLGYLREVTTFKVVFSPCALESD